MSMPIWGRVSFSKLDIASLFVQFPYPTKAEINALAVLIKATPVQIYQW